MRQRSGSDTPATTGTATENSGNTDSTETTSGETTDDTGNSTVAATKAAPDAVGDIVLSDGTAVAAENAGNMSDEQKAKAVAVIFYVGSTGDTLGAKTLGVGLQNVTGDGNTLAWCLEDAIGYGACIGTIQCTPSENGSGAAATATFSGDLDGSDNWQALCDAVDDATISGDYPAWEWVNAYATTASLTGDYASGWYLPTVAELSMLYRVKATVNAALEKAGGTKIADRTIGRLVRTLPKMTSLGVYGSTQVFSTTY